MSANKGNKAACGDGNVKQEVYEEVVERDEEACVLCGRAGSELHHIVARRLLPGKLAHKRDTARNLCVLCWQHHQQAHTKAVRTQLLQLLCDKYGYNYQDWAGYLEEM